MAHFEAIRPFGGTHLQQRFLDRAYATSLDVALVTSNDSELTRVEGPAIESWANG